MTIPPWLLATACAMILSTPLQSQTDNSAEVEKKSTVTKLDGTKLSGFVEVTDDYTLRITNDSGITRVPIAQLGDSSFARYGFRKDRTTGAFGTNAGRRLSSPKRSRNPRQTQNLAKSRPLKRD